MSSFAELLSLYIKQAGITDTELARSIGVSRQTIFRWREGLTSRPNYREDVIAIAQKLRLSPDEKDALLLAGGFRPDDITPSKKEKAGLTDNDEPQEELSVFSNKSILKTREAETETHPTVASIFKILMLKYRRFVFYSISALIIIIAGVWFITSNLPINEPGTSADPSERTTGTPTDIVPATPGEILLIVAQFNSSDTGSKNTDQIIATLRRESTSNRITNIRIEEFPQVIGTDQATQIFHDKGAYLVIYGQYNTGSVTIKTVHIQDQTLPQITLDTNDSISIDALSLIVLAKVCIDTQNTEQAYSFLSKARNTLDDNTVENDEISSLIDELINTINNPETN